MLCLTHRTPDRWVRAALANLDVVLIDHAHCEMKAASNALSLAVRAAPWPAVVEKLVSLAEEEITHFRGVFGELSRRGLSLGPPPPDDYAAELRKNVRAQRDVAAGRLGPQLETLVDRLLVAALIEARSCERFRLLSEALAEGPADLRAFYGDLLAAEARHFRTFVDMAREVAGPDAAWVESRFEQVARIEGELSSRLTGAPAIHG